MPQLGRFDYTVQDTLGNALSGASVSVFREGATVNGAQSGTSPLTVTVRHRGKIVAADSVFINATTGTLYTVNSATATTVVLSGFSGTLALSSGDRLTPSNSQPTLYGDDYGGATTSNPLTSSSTGRANCWMEFGAYDFVVSGGGATTTAFTSQVMPSEAVAQIRVASGFPGTDAGEKIAAAIADLPTTGGVVDARGLTGTQDWATNPFASAPNETLVLLGAATYRAAAQVIIPTKVVVRGVVRQGTTIQANGIAPATGLVKLGSGSGLAFGCRVEDLTVDCNNIAASIGIYSNEINEQSGAKRVLVTQYKSRGINIVDSGALFNDHFLFEDIEVYCSSTAAASDGFYYQSNNRGGTVRRITVGANGAPALQGDGIHILGTDRPGSLRIDGMHVERHTNGLHLDTKGAAILIGGTMGVAGTNLVKIDSVESVSLIGLYHNSIATNTINNTTVGVITDINVPYYFTSSGADTPAGSPRGYEVFTSAKGILAAGNPGYGNVTSENQPMFTIKSMATSGGQSRAHLELQDGNGHGWHVQFDADAAVGLGRPLVFKSITSNTVSAGLIQIGNTGAFYVPDGIAAPATAAGFGAIYIDTADGDLKIKFGDGTVKTIVVDT